MERKQGFFSALKEEVVRGLSPGRPREKSLAINGSPITSFLLRKKNSSRHIASLTLSDDFTTYADVEFGDKSLHWTTLNVVNVFVPGGYDDGMTPPNQCSPPFGMRPLLHQ